MRAREKAEHVILEDGSFWELVDQERHTTWRLCRALTRSYEDAQDLMSDTMLAAYQSFPGLRDARAFRKFLSTIAIRLQRRKQWRGRLFAPLAEADDMGYEIAAESSHDLELLVTALDRLPTREREALVLFELSGLSIKEIQEIQGGTASGVKSRMSRARLKLKDLLLDADFEGERSSREESARVLPAPAFRLQDA
ncbi:MAG: RNA polymerase sigma factor [Candidatus Kapaibacterium sp.]